MNIVIIGEYSSFSKNLKEGFKLIGHNAFVYTWGDTFKKIDPGDNSYLIDVSNFRLFGIKIKGSHILKKPLSAIRLHFHLKKQWKNNKADYVLILNPAFVKKRNNIFIPLVSIKDIRFILTPNGRMFLSACGHDYIYCSFLPNCKKTNEYDISKSYVNVGRERASFLNLIKDIKGVIPVMADYSEAYRFFRNEYKYNICDTIPLPYNVSLAECYNKIVGRIVIMHGITRPHIKGSYIILAALDKLKRKYSDIVEICIVKRLSLSEYLEIMKKSNIIIDQCYSLGYGMNTIEALAMGKVVLSGNEKDNQLEYGVKTNPIISISPNSDIIFSRLEYLVLHPDMIGKISYESRKYAEEIHDCKIIADRYMKTFLND